MMLQENKPTSAERTREQMKAEAQRLRSSKNALSDELKEGLSVLHRSTDEDMLTAESTNDEFVIASTSQITPSKKVELPADEFPKEYFNQIVNNKSWPLITNYIDALLRITRYLAPHAAGNFLFHQTRRTMQVTATAIFERPLRITGHHAKIAMRLLFYTLDRVVENEMKCERATLLNYDLDESHGCGKLELKSSVLTALNKMGYANGIWDITKFYDDANEIFIRSEIMTDDGTSLPIQMPGVTSTRQTPRSVKITTSELAIEGLQNLLTKFDQINFGKIWKTEYEEDLLDEEMEEPPNTQDILQKLQERLETCEKKLEEERIAMKICANPILERIKSYKVPDELDDDKMKEKFEKLLFQAKMLPEINHKKFPTHKSHKDKVDENTANDFIEHTNFRTSGSGWVKRDFLAREVEVVDVYKNIFQSKWKTVVLWAIDIKEQGEKYAWPNSLTIRIVKLGIAAIKATQMQTLNTENMTEVTNLFLKSLEFDIDQESAGQLDPGRVRTRKTSNEKFDSETESPEPCKHKAKKRKCESEGNKVPDFIALLPQKCDDKFLASDSEDDENSLERKYNTKPNTFIANRYFNNYQPSGSRQVDFLFKVFEKFSVVTSRKKIKFFEWHDLTENDFESIKNDENLLEIARWSKFHKHNVIANYKVPELRLNKLQIKRYSLQLIRDSETLNDVIYNPMSNVVIATMMCTECNFLTNTTGELMSHVLQFHIGISQTECFICHRLFESQERNLFPGFIIMCAQRHILESHSYELRIRRINAILETTLPRYNSIAEAEDDIVRGNFRIISTENKRGKKQFHVYIPRTRLWNSVVSRNADWQNLTPIAYAMHKETCVACSSNSVILNNQNTSLSKMEEDEVLKRNSLELWFTKETVPDNVHPFVTTSDDAMRRTLHWSTRMAVERNISVAYDVDEKNLNYGFDKAPPEKLITAEKKDLRKDILNKSLEAVKNINEQHLKQQI